MGFKNSLMEMAKKESEAKAKLMADDEKLMNLYQGDLYQGKRNEEVIQRFLEGKQVVQNIALDLLDDNPNNHFHKIEGDKWEEFLGSVKEYGVVNPIIVRPKDERYEILAGHNRKRAAVEAGLNEIPCIIKDIDDVDASVIIGITNNQRDDTTDLEWGWAYRNTLETIKHQGKKIDEITSAHDNQKLEIDIEDTSRHDDEKSDDEKNTSRHDDEKCKNNKTSISIVAKKYGVGERTAHRKIRLTYLHKVLYEVLTRFKTPQEVMVDLSYLAELDQMNLAAKCEAEKLIITKEMAKELKKKAQELNGEPMRIDPLHKLVDSFNPKSTKQHRPRKYSINDELFPADIKKGDREAYISKVLEYVLSHNIKLD